MKLGVLTLWTNGMSATPALAPRTPSKRDEVALLVPGVSARGSHGETAGTRRLDDVLAPDAKPFFAVDDLAYAMPVKPAPKARPSKPKSSAKPRKRGSSRTHA